ncbi:hypothetical protein ACQEVS_10195 [Streptomyces sp. CA-181903]|uniref:hypothetical protein n=1 Tax=Streptomyces sp. CA-181903 TaxID=3240055 RepID=UPI003D8D02A9
MTTLDCTADAPAPVADPASAELYSRAQVLAAIDDGTTLAADEARTPLPADRFALAVTAVMTLLDEPSASWARVKDRHLQPPSETAGDQAPQYTHKRVSKAVNDGVDLAAEHMGPAPDLDNLVVNAALTLLDDPDATFYTVVAECYADSPRVVRSWL